MIKRILFIIIFFMTPFISKSDINYGVSTALATSALAKTYNQKVHTFSIGLGYFNNNLAFAFGYSTKIKKIGLGLTAAINAKSELAFGFGISYFYDKEFYDYEKVDYLKILKEQNKEIERQEVEIRKIKKIINQRLINK